MKLIVGLGNSGDKYSNTRHNVGFMIVDELAKQLDVSWRTESKLKSAVAEADVDGDKVILAKPQTMMNLSGQAVQGMINFWKIPAENLWLVYDEIDLPLGDIAVKIGGGDSGHQGVRSVHQHIGEGFAHVRVGIDPNDRAVEPSEVYVLKAFDKSQREQLPAVIELACRTVLGNLDSHETGRFRITT